ncbi:hypothetical protein D3C72_1327010 [compost metagenome]
MSCKAIKIILASISSFIGTPQRTAAQGHYNAWMRTTLSIPVRNKISTDVELQHRRQNNFGSSNMFDENLMYSFRTWIHYQYNQNMVFSLAPVACLYSYKMITDQAGALAPPAREYRIAVAADIKRPLSPELSIANRNGLEYRMIQGTTAVLRARTRLGIKYSVNKRIKVSAYDELLLNVQGAGRQHLFDHNRMSAGAEYQFNQKLRMDIGYIYIVRLSQRVEQYVKEQDIYLNLTYTLIR